MTTGDRFRSGFLQTFTSVVRKERAQVLLGARAQLPNETIAIFAEEMTRLFRHAGLEMSDEKKGRFLMSDVKQEIFAGLIRDPPRTVAEFHSDATTIQKTLDMRKSNVTAQR